jgi:glucose-6-phosphate 1-dehydrogenase
MFNLKYFVMLLLPEVVKSIKTCSGGLFHHLKSYNKYDVHEDANFKQIMHSLKLDQATVIYYAEVSPNGFVIHTKGVAIRYKHDDYSTDGRIIELKF